MDAVHASLGGGEALERLSTPDCSEFLWGIWQGCVSLVSEGRGCEIPEKDWNQGVAGWRPDGARRKE
eukprot:gene9264-biopygen1660